MYVLRTYDDDRYFAGYVCGCAILKYHISRAALFETEADAMDTARAYRIEDEVYLEFIEGEI